MDVEKIIREYITDIVHLSLATESNGKPWISEVHFAYDEDLNIYFFSKLIRRHSQEIKSNSSVAGNIVKQHTKQEKVRGVYFEGVCNVLEDITAQHPAFVSLQSRLGFGDEQLREQSDAEGHRFYKISVEKFYLFDELEMSPPGKYELSWNK